MSALKSLYKPWVPELVTNIITHLLPQQSPLYTEQKSSVCLRPGSVAQAKTTFIFEKNCYEGKWFGFLLVCLLYW
jgi:hypothetical protein